MSETTTTTAATSPGQAGAGQAASAQQGAPQQGPTSVQGGQGPQGQGQQGATSPTTPQPGTPEGTTASTATPAPAPGVPERYELRLPDQSLLDQADVDAIVTMAKDGQWTTEQAQAALTDMHTSLVEQTARFRARLDADPEVGGARLEQTQLLARGVLDRFLPERETLGAELRAAMNKSGYGNYLPLVTLLARIGQAMREDQPTMGTGRTANATRRSDADVLFGDAQGIVKAS